MGKRLLSRSMRWRPLKARSSGIYVGLMLPREHCNDLYHLYRLLSSDGTHTTLNAINRYVAHDAAMQITAVNVGPDTKDLVETLEDCLLNIPVGRRSLRTRLRPKRHYSPDNGATSLLQGVARRPNRVTWSSSPTAAQPSTTSATSPPKAPAKRRTGRGHRLPYGAWPRPLSASVSSRNVNTASILDCCASPSQDALGPWELISAGAASFSKRLRLAKLGKCCEPALVSHR